MVVLAHLKLLEIMSSQVVGLVLFASYTVTSVSGLLVVKHWLPSAKAAWQSSSGLTLPGFLVFIGAALYIISFLIWMVILERSEISVAYPTAIGLTLTFSTLGAVLLLGEAVSVLNIFGMFLIFIGIILVVVY